LLDTSIIEVLQRPLESAQYTSKDFADLARENGVVLSVGRKGECWDNAVAESFFARRIQPVSARTSASFSTGVMNPSALRGRRFRLSAMRTSPSELWSERSVPFGMY
jgi:transposase InsO family protein